MNKYQITIILVILVVANSGRGRSHTWPRVQEPQLHTQQQPTIRSTKDSKDKQPKNGKDKQPKDGQNEQPKDGQDQQPNDGKDKKELTKIFVNLGKDQKDSMGYFISDKSLLKFFILNINIGTGNQLKIQKNFNRLLQKMEHYGILKPCIQIGSTAAAKYQKKLSELGLKGKALQNNKNTLYCL